MLYIVITYLAAPVLYVLILLRRRKQIKNILVIQTAKIGDVICSTPVFREIKKGYPEAHLTVMATPVTLELLEINPHVDEIITMNHKDYKGPSGKLRLANLLRKRKFDIAVCLNPNVLFACATFWGLVPVRLSVMPDFSGSTFKLAAFFFSSLERHVKGRLVIETYLRMLRAIGIESNNISKEVYKSETAENRVSQRISELKKPLIGIAVSSGNKLKEMGPEKIIQLAAILLDTTDVFIVLIGSSQDRGTSSLIRKALGKKERILDVTGEFGLGELPALIERLSLLVGVDTGIVYMADALSVPVIDIAGPSDMEDQRPTGAKSMILQKKVQCVPCSHAFHAPYACVRNTRECIQLMSIDEICYAIKKFFPEVHCP